MREFQPVDAARPPLVSSLSRSLKQVYPLPDDDAQIKRLVKMLDEPAR